MPVGAKEAKRRKKIAGMWKKKYLAAISILQSSHMERLEVCIIQSMNDLNKTLVWITPVNWCFSQLKQWE